MANASRIERMMTAPSRASLRVSDNGGASGLLS
jgi:hypothetical protein